MSRTSGFVLREQHCLACGFANERIFQDSIDIKCLIVRNAREIDFKPAAHAGFGINENEPPGLLHDAIDGRQSEARSLARILFVGKMARRYGPWFLRPCRCRYR